MSLKITLKHHLGKQLDADVKIKIINGKNLKGKLWSICSSNCFHQVKYILILYAECKVELKHKNGHFIRIPTVP